MKQTTLVFLVKKNLEGKISDVLLAMKKRGFGKGNWNGAGGKLEVGESVEEGLLREVKEELDITPIDYHKTAIINFVFTDKTDWNQECHIFICENWEGDPKESEEMKPEWYKVDKLPLNSMWESDRYWLPIMLTGKSLTAKFEFLAEGGMVGHKVEISNI